MTQARMIKFLGYVKQVNDLYRGDVHAIFTVGYREKAVKLWFNDKIHGKPDNRFYIYNSSPWCKDSIDGTIYTMFDPNLARAEKHILRLIREANNKGESDERETVSGE